MTRFWTWAYVVLAVVVAVTVVSAQDAGPGAAITITDQIAVNGIVTVLSATVPEAGWVVIHSVVDGQMGPTVGIAPLQAGENTNVQVMVDALGASPQLIAVLHADTGQPNVFENDMQPDTDPALMQGNQSVQAPFNLTALTVFPQMLTNNAAVIASVVTAQNVWVAVYADSSGQPGSLLGSAMLPAGAYSGIPVPVVAEGQTETLHVMLHADAGTAGTFEFDGQSGADTVLELNGVRASAPITTSQTPVVMTAVGTPLNADPLPSFNVPPQDAMGDGVTGTLAVDTVVSPVPGWLEIHADAMGRPGKPLGMVSVPQGESTALSVPLDAGMVPAAPLESISPVAWPMLHVDDNQQGVYEYLMVPGADTPIVVNGLIVTYPVTLAPTDGVQGVDTLTGEQGVDSTMGADTTGGDTLGSLEGAEVTPVPTAAG